MWEVLYNFSHGRISVRRFSLFITTILMVFFMASLPAQQAFAEDAQRVGANITYAGKTFTPIHAGNNADKVPVPPGLPSSTTGYYSLDAATKKVSLLLTTAAVDQATSAQYVIYDFTPPGNFSNPSPPQTVAISTAPAAASTATSTCSGSTLGGIGWIVCPIVHFIAKSMDFIYGIIASFLEVKTVTADTAGPVYKLWSIVRDIANVSFVIAFLLIVYSQVTSMGISNFGIKKMLPRLVIAAIALNLSYWICAFAVDASNILGYSIHNLFTSLFTSLGSGSNFTGSIPTWEQVAGVSLAGAGAVVGTVAVVSAGVGSSVILLIPILVGAAIAALVALIVLAARQALLMCLIIIAPLAFVAYILPNTEKYFEKWRSATLTLLMLFPIFSVIFSGAQLAGMTIVQTAGGSLVTIILGMGVQVAPIIITPLLIKFSTGIIGKVGGMINNPSKGVLDKTRTWAKGAAQERKNKILTDQNRLKGLNNSWLNPVTKGTRAMDQRRRYREGKRKTYETMADTAFAGSRKGATLEGMNRSATNDKQRVDNRFASSARGQKLELESRHIGVEKTEIDNRLTASAGGQALEARTRSANIHKQEITNTFERSHAGHQLHQRQEMAEIDKQNVHNEFENSSLGHQVDQAKRIANAEKQRIDHTHQASWDQAIRTDAALLEMELGVKASEVKASVEKAKVEKMHAEILAQGSASEHILSLRGIPATKAGAHQTAGMLNIAHDIKRESLETSVIATAKNMADQVTAQHRTQALIEDKVVIDGKTIVEYAAGVKGASGRRAIIARAKSEDSAVFMEDIKNIQNTLDYDLSTDNKRLRQEFENTDVLAEKIVYAKSIAKNGGPGVAAFRQLLSDIGDFTNPNLVKQEDMLFFKEVLASEGAIMSAGKDIEFFLTNSTVNDTNGDPIMGTNGKPTYRTFDNLKSDIRTWTNLTPVAFAGQSPTTQFYALEHLYANDRPAYQRIIESIRTNPAAVGAIKQQVAQKFSIYSPAQIDSARRAGSPLPDPGTVI